MESKIPQLRTPGVIATELGVPLTRVLYVLRKLNVRPIGRAGCLRLFGHDAVAIVRDALREIDHAKQEALQHACERVPTDTDGCPSVNRKMGGA